MKIILKRCYILILTLIISICMISISIHVSAEVYEKNEIEVEKNKTEKFLAEVTEKSKTLDMFEVETMREENVKHYRLPDGTYKAISYDRPVHIMDEDGNWQEIDNTLILNDNKYKTKDNRVLFAKKISSSEVFMKYKDVDYSISWNILDNRISNNSEAIVNNLNLFENSQTDLTSEQMFNVLKSSSINYSNIFENVNLEVILEGKSTVNKFKFETIKNKYSISFVLNVENLDVKLENNSLMFYNIKDGNIEYRMLQPYIKYKNQIDSTVSQYKVEKIDKDKLEYLLTIEIDLSKYDLIEKNNDLTRLLPNGPELVIIGTLDGGSGGGSSTPIVYDTYVSSTNTTTNYGSSPEVKISSGNTQIGYFKINEPAIPDGSTITDAFFRIPYYFTTSSSNYVNIGAYQILSDWSETSVTWSSNTNISSTRLSSASTYASATENNPEYVTLGIVEAAKSWYSRSLNNHGIAVKYENGNESTVFMKSWESHTESSTMTIDYNMDELIIKEGNYYIKNGHLDKYIQIDDGDSDNSYNTEDAILEVWTGTGVSFQKWDFEYLHNGYYKIKSHRSGKVISVAEGNENSSNDALVQQTYNGSDRQQWKIIESDSEMYVIKAKSSEGFSINRVMCSGDGIGEDGRNVEQREYSNNNIYKDEWIIESFLPCSGSEINYDTSLWNYQPVQSRTNCFSYAFNNQVYPNTNTLFWINPTYSDGNRIAQSDIQVDKIEEYVINITDKYNLQFEKVDENIVCPPGTYKVALVIDPGNDYHWYRQNPDATWSHKPGDGEVTNLDASGNIIINPRTANRNYNINIGCIHYNINYTEFIGFYKVTPLGNIYKADRTAINEFIRFENDINKRVNYLKLSKLKINMAYSEVVELIGLPHITLKFGLLTVGYLLSNGDLLSIEYDEINGIICVKNFELYETGEFR